MTEHLERTELGVDSDLWLAHAFVAGDDGALHSAYERWGGLVHGLAVKSVGPGDADDVTQQVFVSAWQSRSRYRVDHAPLGAWLVGITRHRIADHLGHRYRQHEVSADPDVLLGNLDQRPAPNAMTPERIDPIVAVVGRTRSNRQSAASGNDSCVFRRFDARTDFRALRYAARNRQKSYRAHLAPTQNPIGG